MEMVTEEFGVQSEQSSGNKRVQEANVNLSFVVTNPVATIFVGVGSSSSLAAVVRFTIGILETRDTSEIALTEEGSADETSVTED